MNDVERVARAICQDDVKNPKYKAYKDFDLMVEDSKHSYMRVAEIAMNEHLKILIEKVRKEFDEGCEYFKETGSTAKTWPVLGVEDWLKQQVIV
jgi:hypothetical protein